MLLSDYIKLQIINVFQTTNIGKPTELFPSKRTIVTQARVILKDAKKNFLYVFVCVRFEFQQW